MKIMSLFVILGCILVVSVSIFWKESQKNCRIQTEEGIWRLEIARTFEQQTRGLMGRRELCEKCGMLFVFEDEQYQAFWMKDTLIPLDMYFYDKNGQLVDGVLNMRPEHETFEPMQYRSKKPVKYVVEINHGESWDTSLIISQQCDL